MFIIVTDSRAARVDSGGHYSAVLIDMIYKPPRAFYYDSIMSLNEKAARTCVQNLAGALALEKIEFIVIKNPPTARTGDCGPSTLQVIDILVHERILRRRTTESVSYYIAPRLADPVTYRQTLVKKLQDLKKDFDTTEEGKANKKKVQETEAQDKRDQEAHRKEQEKQSKAAAAAARQKEAQDKKDAEEEAKRAATEKKISDLTQAEITTLDDLANSKDTFLASALQEYLDDHNGVKYIQHGPNTRRESRKFAKFLPSAGWDAGDITEEQATNPLAEEFRALDPHQMEHIFVRTCLAATIGITDDQPGKSNEPVEESNEPADGNGGTTS